MSLSEGHGIPKLLGRGVTYGGTFQADFYVHILLLTHCCLIDDAPLTIIDALPIIWRPMCSLLVVFSLSSLVRHRQLRTEIGVETTFGARELMEW